MAAKDPIAVLDDPLFGWWSRQGEPAVMAFAHRHNELELNLLERGKITYIFPGRRLELHAGQLFFFWSAVPHQLVARSHDAYIHWMTIPLSWALHRGMPESLTRPLLEGKPLLGDIDPQEQPVDIMAFHRWHTYLDRGDGESRTILALEVEARIRRLVLNHKEGLYEAKILPAGKAEDIAHYLADHYMEEWAVSDAARNAGLHPNYAMAIFRRAFGISMVAYVTQLRVAMAQQLLVSGEMDVLQVGFESGFGSTSRFYAAFKAQTGQTPLAYRRALKWGSGDLPREKRGL